MSLVLNSIGVSLLHERRRVARVHNAALGQVETESRFTILVDGAAAGDLLQTVAHKQLVVAAGEESRGNVDEDGDPGVVVVAEDFAAEEDCGNHASTKVTSQIGADCDVGESMGRFSMIVRVGVRVYG